MCASDCYGCRSSDQSATRIRVHCGSCHSHLGKMVTVGLRNVVACSRGERAKTRPFSRVDLPRKSGRVFERNYAAFHTGASYSAGLT
jgi:hypothetical protein